MNELDSKIQKESRIAGIVSLAGFIVIIGFFIFSFVELDKLNKKLDSKKRASMELDSILAQKIDSMKVLETQIELGKKALESIESVVDKTENEGLKSLVGSILIEEQTASKGIAIDLMNKPPVLIPQQNDQKINESPSATSGNATQKRSPILFVQVSGPEMESKLRDSGFDKKLIQEGFRVPKHELKPKGCDNSVRYFFKEDEASAMLAQKTAQELLGHKFSLRFMPALAQVARPNQIEIWVEDPQFDLKRSPKGK